MEIGLVMAPSRRTIRSTMVRGRPGLDTELSQRRRADDTPRVDISSSKTTIAGWEPVQKLVVAILALEADTAVPRIAGVVNSCSRIE